LTQHHFNILLEDSPEDLKEPFAFRNSEVIGNKSIIDKIKQDQAKGLYNWILPISMPGTYVHTYIQWGLVDKNRTARAFIPAAASPPELDL
jgi:hypothetical protein